MWGLEVPQAGRWARVFGAIILGIGVAPTSWGQTAAEPPASETRIEEQRAHQTYQGHMAASPATPPADWAGRRMPESSFIIRRWKDRSGTTRIQFHYMVDLGSGVRIHQRTDTDYFTCRGTEKVELIWSPENREYLLSSEDIAKCPDHTEEGFAAWARLVAANKVAAPANRLRTFETKQIRVAVDWDEWLAKGNPEIQQSLSAEFAKVLIDELVPLSRVDSLASELCRSLAGLFLLDCGNGTEAAWLLRVEKADCDFDATFDQPCTAEQQRDFDARKGRVTLSPSPNPTLK